MESASPFNSNSRSVLRRLVAPAQEIEFDKSGRLSIPQSLREYAGLEKTVLFWVSINLLSCGMRKNTRHI